MADVKQIMLENDFLISRNSNYRSYCQDVSDYCLPRKGWINTLRYQGDRIKFNFLYDSTAIGAVRDTASGFHTYLSNPSSRWFGMRYRNPDLRDRREVKQFCHDVEDWCFEKYEESNFYNCIQEFYTDEVAFGTSAFSMLSDPKKFVRFNQIPINQIIRVLDANGELCGFYRNFPLTAMQAFKMWGSDAGEEVTKSMESKPYQEFEFLHYVGERYDRDTSKMDSSNMPYTSCWINKKEKKIIAESGFMEMPYISEVFYTSGNGDPNGLSPSMDCFAEIKLVNAMQRTFIRADMKGADPSYILPSKGFILPLNLNPGAANYRDPKTNRDDIQMLPMGTGKLNITMEHIKMVQDAIKDRMYVKLFKSLDELTKQMTILEIQQRLAQAMSVLGPTVNRFTNGVLGKATQRLIAMGARDPLSGFPEVPEILANQDYSLIYLSPMAKAQRQSEVQEIQAFLGDVASVGSIIPTVYDKIDEDKLVDVLHRVRGITPEILREEDEVIQRRKLHQEQNALIASLQGGQAVADIGKTAADAQAAVEKK